LVAATASARRAGKLGAAGVGEKIHGDGDGSVILKEHLLWGNESALFRG